MIRLAILALVLATGQPDTIDNESLKVTVQAGSSGDINGLVVTKVTPGSPGRLTGLSVGDVLLGGAIVDVFDLVATEEFHEFTPGTFKEFPPSFGHMNQEFRLLVHRPSRDRTAILTVRFGGAPTAWPRGKLGIIAVERPNEPIHLHTRDIDVPPDVVVERVHPHTLADRLGIRAGDAIAHVVVRPKDGEPTRIPVNSLADLLIALKPYPDTAEIILKVLRPVIAGAPSDSGDLEFRSTPDML